MSAGSLTRAILLTAALSMSLGVSCVFAEPTAWAENPASSPPHDNQNDACEHAALIARQNAAAMAHTENITILSQRCDRCHTIDTTGTAQEGMTVWVCTAYVDWKRN